MGVMMFVCLLLSPVLGREPQNRTHSWDVSSTPEAKKAASKLLYGDPRFAAALAKSQKILAAGAKSN